MRRLLVVLAVLAIVGGVAFAADVKNPDTLVFASYGDVVSLDPAVAYDNVSGSMISLFYDRLINYKGADLGNFVPSLATEVPTVANGGISKDGKTYTFKIRQGVKFSNGYPLTAEDVAYSFKRDLVLDPTAGPNWMWYQVFLGSGGSRDANDKINVKFSDIDGIAKVVGNTVVFKLVAAYPAFLSIVANTFGSIVSKKWCIEQGDWDGTEATWQKYNNPATGKEGLYNKAMGTGPYTLVKWDKGIEVDVTRNDGYFGTKPVLKNGVYKEVQEWATRKLMLLQGDADIVTVNADAYPEMDKETGIQIIKDLPTLDLTGMHFNFKINDKANPNIYSAKLDGQGIPSDFFSDINVRYAFQYAWDEKTFLHDVMNDTASDPVTPFPKGLPYKKALESRPFDTAQAIAYFKKAWGGKLWDVGMKFDIVYNTGNTVRETGAKMLAESVNALNPKFQVGTRGVEWANYNDMNKNKQMAIFYLGWLPDYPDPDDYANPYMASSGYFAGRQSYSNPTADSLVAKAAIELDTTKRQIEYYQLQDIWLNDAPAILTTQPLNRRYIKDWVKGYYYTPMEAMEFDRLPDMSKG